MLDIKKMLSHIVDNLTTLNTKTAERYVVETGTDNGWSYIKYSDGTFEAWKEYSGSLTIQSTAGSLYTSNSYVNTQLPDTSALNITDIKYVNVTIMNGNYPVWAVIRAATSTALTWQPMSSSSRSQTTYPIQVYMYGLGG